MNGFFVYKMKKTLVTSFFCLFLWTLAVPSSQAWFWSNKTSQELASELAQLKSKKSSLEARQAKLKETIATGKANNDTISDLEDVREDLAEINEDIDKTWQAQLKTAGEEQFEKNKRN